MHHWRIRLMVLLWVAAAIMISFLVWMHYANRIEPSKSGAAVINVLGDVVEWPADAAAVIGEKDMIGRNLFELVPLVRRDRNRSQFERAVDGPPYRFPHIWWTDGEQVVSVSFKRRNDTQIEATFTR